MTPQEQDQTLKDLQKAISEVDAKRALKRLTDEQREALEMTAVGLREAERLLISKTQKKVLADMEEITKDINRLSKDIRARITKMNAFPKGVAKVEAVLSAAVKLLIAAAKW
jgi:poly(3-hydroxyalkanoate) synthetase